MVQAADPGHADSLREVYKFKLIKPEKANKDKCTAIDAYDQVVVLGVNASVGHVCPLIKDASSGEVDYDLYIPQYDTQFRANAKVSLIKYLARLDYFALLHDKQLTILKQHDLMPIQTYKSKKITNFCLNEEVYRGGGGNRQVSQTDQICICVTSQLYFLEAEFVNGIYKFNDERSRPDRQRGFDIKVTPEQLVWDGDRIYMACKRTQSQLINLNLRATNQESGSITILNANDGSIIANFPLQQGDVPMMSVLNDKVLVLNQQGQRANFLQIPMGGNNTTANLQRSPSFQLDHYATASQMVGGQQATPQSVVSINLVAEYVVAVYEYSIVIFKSDGAFLQSISPTQLNNINAQHKFKYVKGQINRNPSGDSEIVILATNLKETKNTPQTQVVVLSEIDTQTQISGLLGLGRIEEANEIFCTKQAKQADNFQEKKKEFDLNAGWQMLNTGHPESVLKYFKMSDVDPRELIILFKDITEDLRPAFNDHIKNNRTQDLKQMYTALESQRHDTNFNAQEKFQKAKDMLKGLFHHLNQRYLSELRKDEDKQADFIYSIYTTNQDAIKKDEKRLLKDILPFVQTALIRLYIEDEVDGRQKIYDFFNQFSSGSQQRSHLLLLETEMHNFLNKPTLRTKEGITNEALALLQEHLGQYQQALDIWVSTPPTNEARSRIIHILKKSGGSKDWINLYGRKVFEEAPDIGLKLFQNEASPENGDHSYAGGDFVESYDSISMTTEEIIEFLQKIEDDYKKKQEQGGRARAGRAAAQNSNSEYGGGLCLTQKYLEQITKDSRTDQQYFTKLGKLLIQKCVTIKEDQDPDLAFKYKEALTNAREELYRFLESKDQYNASELSQEVQKKSWMDKEAILLLVREKKYEQAIEKYLKDEKFKEAAEFCASHSQQDGLLTQLLKKYFQKYKEAQDQSLGSNDRDFLKKAKQYRDLATELMQQNASTGLLDPLEVIQQIPDDWQLQGEEYDMIEFLSSLFDSQMTKEENSMIAANLSGLESFNAEIEKRDLESAYLVVRDETECPWCNKTLGFKKIRIFPHGMAFHMRCAKPNECPITKQRFDIDPVTQYD